MVRVLLNGICLSKFSINGIRHDANVRMYIRTTSWQNESLAAFDRTSSVRHGQNWLWAAITAAVDNGKEQ